jgi:hypothetical protein
MAKITVHNHSSHDLWVTGPEHTQTPLTVPQNTSMTTNYTGREWSFCYGHLDAVYSITKTLYSGIFNITNNGMFKPDGNKCANWTVQYINVPPLL